MTTVKYDYNVQITYNGLKLGINNGTLITNYNPPYVYSIPKPSRSNTVYQTSAMSTTYKCKRRITQSIIVDEQFRTCYNFIVTINVLDDTKATYSINSDYLLTLQNENRFTLFFNVHKSIRKKILSYSYTITATKM